MLKTKLYNGINYEHLRLFTIFLLSAISVYFTPPLIQRLFFLCILALYFWSKKSYFWISLFFLLMSTPAGFFSGQLYSDTQRLPIYSLGKGFSFSFFDLFYITTIVKILFNKRQYRGYYFKKSLLIVIIYGIFLILFSIMLGIIPTDMVSIIRYVILPIIFFLLAPQLIINETQYINLVKLILPYVFLSFIGQLYEISYGKYLISIVKTGYSTIASTGAAVAEGSNEVARIFDAWMLNTFSLFISCFLLIQRDKRFSPTYLIIIISINFTICYSSATRGIFLTYLVIIITFIYIILFNSTIHKHYLKYIFIATGVILVGIIIVLNSFVIRTQLLRSTQRLSTINLIIHGDVTTVKLRVEERIPKLLRKFEESPYIGWGFSSEGLRYQDGHVGIHNMLREGGVLEIIFFIFFLTEINLGLYLCGKNRNLMRRERYAFNFAIIAICSLLIMHSSSSQFFGYFIGAQPNEKWLFLTFILVGLNIYYYKSKSLREKLDYDSTNNNNILLTQSKGY
jgi:hypothetical protein